MSISRVLVVDDEQGMVRSVERILRNEYEVACTISSRDALEMAKAFKPDLAILDIQMPDIDGFELMDGLKAIDHGLDVIFMTGSIHEIDSKLIRSIRKNAFYFLNKPFDREVLLTLVERCFELRRLQAENRRHLERIENEIAEARRFQQSLLPPRRAKIGRVSVFVQYAPCSELAGDFYDYAGVGEDAVLLVADVSGHGASAAMLTAIVKSAFHSANVDNYEPSSVVQRVSKGIATFGYHQFITLICVRVRAGYLEYVSAGHPPGILASFEHGAVRLAETGPVISPAFPHFIWEQNTISIKENHRLVLFTDGIIETASKSDEYGIDRLLQRVLVNTADGSILSQQILEDVRRFASDTAIHDDLTLVVADL